ncbi:sister chromatid cohesion 1 protein 2-like [Nymphaea colorata]|nr:sister chromatid cohesion 1 protein 2-like [Nymphaea colorata]XP_031481126.1 sister chromatid cohesion 1 protein 2-like [Nymphaea colorata]
MFYSQCMLSSNGPLNTLWVAAHLQRKLKKAQVLHTDIPSSVDYIIKDPIEVPIALRISGYLLVGVARIYSKKVDYLYDDCNEILAKLRNSWASIRVSLPEQTSVAPFHCITLPDKFELDALDLEELGYRTEEPTNQHVKAYERITFEDEQERQENLEVDMDYQMGAAAHSVPADKLPPEDEVLPPHPIDTDFDMDGFDAYDYETVRGKFRENHMYEENEPAILEIHEPSDSHCRSVRFEDQSASVVKCSHEEHKKLSKLTSFDTEEVLVPAKDYTLLPSTVSESPHKVPDSSVLLPSNDGDFPEFMPVPTPKKEEQNWKSRKRKVPLRKPKGTVPLFDENIILPNEVMRHRLHDTSSILRCRRTVPFAGLDVWGASRISSIQEMFLKPFTSCVSPELRELLMKNLVKPKTMAQLLEPLEMDEANGAASRFNGTPIAEEYFASVAEQNQPDMPAKKRLRPRQLILPDDKPDTVQADVQNMENEQGTLSEPTLDFNLLGDDSDLVTADAGSGSAFVGFNHWPIRTKVVTQFLRNVWEGGKLQNQDKVLNMADILKGKTRKECARFFMEILVLKSQDFVDVKQDSPYADIHLTPLPKLSKLRILNGS